MIDAAQQNLTNLTGEIVGLKDILSNKQTRGAYGQGRMEAIIRDGLPASAFEFQATLSNRTRPDCLVRLPGDERGLVIDAKFPLEGFTLFREAKGDEARSRAAARVRNDMLVHVKDIAEKYLIPGETQDIAMLFVPAESIYADLAEHFDDVVQKAHRARIVIVSPSLLTLAIQVMQALVRDARIREEARVIQVEVQKLLEDVDAARFPRGEARRAFPPGAGRRLADQGLDRQDREARREDRDPGIRRGRNGGESRIAAPSGPESARRGLGGNRLRTRQRSSQAERARQAMMALVTLAFLRTREGLRHGPFLEGHQVVG